MKQLFVFIILLYSLTELLGQSTTVASGGVASGSMGRVSYTVGQAFYKAHNSSKGSSSEGVQQPFEIYVVSVVEHLPFNIHVLTYPNPTFDLLILRVKSEKSSLQKRLWYSLFNETGKLIEHKRISQLETKIEMGAYSPGVYFLHLEDHSKDSKRLIQNFKIIKN